MSLPPLSPEQQDVVNYLHSSDPTDHIFVTGKAGTGKTTVLRAFQRDARKRVRVCAPTGVAALNASGSTIHNLIGLRTSLPADNGIEYHILRANHKDLLEVDVLVVDEVSMVSSDLLDAMNRNLQAIRGDSSPFGGIQMVFFGDLYQLPPVVSREDQRYYDDVGYRSPWFFDADVWQDDAELKTVELTQIHRQADETFIRLLNGVRDGSISPEDLALLNALGRRTGATKDTTMLASRRRAVNEYNGRRLNRLIGKRDTYIARVNSGFGTMEPADREIVLKPGARIMMLSNDYNDRWVNGTLGHVKQCGTDFIQVELDDGQVHVVDRYSWVKAGTPPEEWKTAPKFYQFPVKLAWSMSIHKSQGLSLDEITVDLGDGAFSPGQTYVALSRARTPEGVYFKTPVRRSDIRVDPHVKRFFEENRE